MSAFRHDRAHLVSPGVPLAVVRASTTEDVVASLRWAHEHGVPVVPRGAGTGLAGGASAIEGGLVLCTTRMDAILEISVPDQLAVVEAGVVTGDLDRAAAAHGLMYAPDPGSVDTCTIGGNVATNAGGLRCAKYGVTRDSVLGLKVVLADGRVLETGGRTVKNVAGYDLTALMTGSEGTLGVVTEVVVRLRPRPVALATIVGTFPTGRHAGAAAAGVMAAGLQPSLLELMDRSIVEAINSWKGLGLDGTGAVLLAQADGPTSAADAARIRTHFEAAGAETVTVSDSATEAHELAEVRRLAFPATERLGSCLVEDVGVPRSRLPDLIDRIEEIGVRHGVRIMTVAHAGDGNAHPTFVFDPGPDGAVPPRVWSAADEVFSAALSMGGTLSGEHGVGVLKQRWLASQVGDVAMDVQRAIKHALDPLGLLNPGRAI
ncbi:FAD-binding oxidoreductase [Nocardioides campestrisoli]|uniref:FAD-binding oxidoreductase n=1 Tax=Nocardioides campestrisoli TaxID=2736757 RepID=UPI00163D517F|nr:FAD-linked oxidase C-terminal domain-containing protein [Nocardioides campestrisoli]